MLPTYSSTKKLGENRASKIENKRRLKLSKKLLIRNGEAPKVKKGYLKHSNW